MGVPSGTVTFLFTDIEGSTPLWDERPEAMGPALARHDALLRSAIEGHGGFVFQTAGDGMAAAFQRSADAVRAAVDAQRALLAEPWPAGAELRVRMGLYTGEAEEREGNYFGAPLNRAARLMAVAHGGQVLVSHETVVVGRDDLPPGTSLVDLGLHRLRGLAGPMHVYQLVCPGLRERFPPLRSLKALAGNLPRQVTTFVGREQEIAGVGALVRERPLVTLTGVGGVGKTRLALQVAADVVAEFADGAWLCALAPVSAPGAVWDALAASLGLQRVSGRPPEQVVLDYLGSKRLLVVLDNCEHLLDAVAGLVTTIMRDCAEVSVLATSREGLALAGEQIVAVPSLGVPGADASADRIAAAEAVRLFCERAREAKRDFTLDGRNAVAVAQLCRRLDGIPLAIELAAARVGSLRPEDLVARLDQRFRLLTRGSRASLERHQTLRSTIDWSYHLLTLTEQGVLNRLSVPSGGFDLAAAEVVAATGGLDALDVANVLSRLVDKSLLVVDDEGGARYRLLETIRQYAQERLEASGEAPEARRRHAEHYVGVAEAAGVHLRRREQLTWAATVAREADNVRAVLDWSVETGSVDHALRLVPPLAVAGLPTWSTALDWAEVARAIPGAQEHPLYPLVVAHASQRATMAADLDLADDLARRALEAQSRLGTAHAEVHASLALVALSRGEHERAERHGTQWVDLARATGDPYEISCALVLLAVASTRDPARAVAIAEEAAQVSRDAGIPSTLWIALSLVSGLLPFEEHMRALAALDEGVEAITSIGDTLGVLTLLSTRGWISARAQDWRAALRSFLGSAELQLESGSWFLPGSPLWGAAIALAQLGQLEPAALLIGVADAHFGRSGTGDFPELVSSAEAAVSDGLTPHEAQKLKARGATLQLREAVEYLRDKSGMALSESAP